MSIYSRITISLFLSVSGHIVGPGIYSSEIWHLEPNREMLTSKVMHVAISGNGRASSDRNV